MAPFESLSEIRLTDRKVLPIENHPVMASRHQPFGVDLTNEEAQDFIRRGYRVFGDSEGPYLVVRLSAKRSMTIFDPDHVDLLLLPQRWTLRGTEQSGIICWLLEAS